MRRFFRRYHFPARNKYNKTDKESGDLNDSLWASIASFSKWYRVSFEYILYEMSFENFVMYNSVVPSYDTDRDKGKKGNDDGRRLNADDPKNNKEIIDFLKTIR